MGENETGTVCVDTGCPSLSQVIIIYPDYTKDFVLKVFWNQRGATTLMQGPSINDIHKILWFFYPLPLVCI